MKAEAAVGQFIKARVHGPDPVESWSDLGAEVLDFIGGLFLEQVAGAVPMTTVRQDGVACRVMPIHRWDEPPRTPKTQAYRLVPKEAAE